MERMAASRLALFLLVYVSLDVANPLMPGAVQFVHGSVEVVQADRARPEGLAGPALLVHPPTLGQTDVVEQIAPCSCPVIVDRGRAFLPARRRPDRASDPASPSEDH